VSDLAGARPRVTHPAILNDMDEGAGASRVVIVGGGIAGVEAALALADLAGRRVETIVVSPDEEFVLKPMVVRQPFGGEEPARHRLEPVLSKAGVGFRQANVAAVHADEKVVGLADGEELSYDFLIVCVGGHPVAPYESATTFWSSSGRMPVDKLLSQGAGHPSKTLAVVVPPQTTWPLPAYELALLLRRQARELRADAEVRLITPEDHPLGIFGLAASGEVAARMRAAGVAVETGVRMEEVDGQLVRTGGTPLDAGAVIALPRIEGPRVPGLPADDDGFLRTDEHCRVMGVEGVYAAGDGTSFPLKQGGIATQQADAAAAHIAASLGALSDPEPFTPVLRGELLTGGRSIKMKHALTGGDQGEVSPDYLWWPRMKVSGRYLSAWLTQSEPSVDPSPRDVPIEVEASWPHEWHSQPSLGPQD
jgi:sulfide:quinone oxidoreductase